MHDLVVREVQAHEGRNTGDPQDLIDFYLAQITKASTCLSHYALPSLKAHYKDLPLSNCCGIFICMLYLLSTADLFWGAAHCFHQKMNNFYMTNEMSQIIYFIVFL